MHRPIPLFDAYDSFDRISWRSIINLIFVENFARWRLNDEVQVAT